MKKLITYITASLPNKNFTTDMINIMSENGADAIELGIPFSDPSADGEVIEKASLMSLKSGFKIAEIIDIIKDVPNSDLYLMGYFNSFYKKGFDYYFSNSFKNLKGLVIPDLPYEESLKYLNIFDKYDKALVSFVSPLSNKNRIETTIRHARGFIYLVAYAGITGGGKDMNLDNIIYHIKDTSDTPIYIGFGVNENNAKQKVKNIDGVIVATAFIKILLQEDISYSEKSKQIALMCRNIKDAINS